MFHKRKGLGFNRVRYNIGGGGEIRNDSQFREQEFEFRLVPGFKPSASSEFDWSADRNQRQILLGARELGANNFEAFSNSPPAWMTNSKDFTGANEPFQENLPPQNHEAFADYLTEVVRVYKKKYGLIFNTLEPFNEPLGSDWVKGNKQEGCFFDIPSIDVIIPLVARKLREKNLTTEVVGTDSMIKDGQKMYNNLGEDSLNLMAQINVHSYERRKVLENLGLRVQMRKEMAQIGKRIKKRIVVTESGPFRYKGTEHDIALMLAKTIFLDINIMRATAWTYWQAVEGFEGRPYWGLIYAKWTYSTPLEYRLRPQYYILKHFSTWITQGSIPLQIPSPCVSGLVAFYDPLNQRTVVVISNFLLRKNLFSLEIQGFKALEGKQSLLLRYRTTKFKNYKRLRNVPVQFPFSVRLEMAPRSIMTLVFTNVSYY